MVARWIVWAGLAFALGAASSACTAQLRDDEGSTEADGSKRPGAVDDDLAAACEDVGVDVGPTVLRRLSNLEYRLTLEDLFALQEPPVLAGLPGDTNHNGFETYAALQTVSAQHLRAYWEAAELLASDLLADEERAASIIGCDWEDASCLSGFVERFGMLAFRRPLQPDERNAFVAAAEESALDVPDRYRFVIETLLLSPHFLYRVEVGDSPDGLSTLGAYELASRLSFSLWGRSPDEDLLSRAGRGELDTDDGLRDVARQLATDSRTETFFGAFFEQWLGFAKLAPPKEPPADWDDSLLDHMAAETHAVLAEHAWQGLDFFDVLTTNSTYLTPELGAFYGVEPAGATFDATTPFDFPQGHPRSETGLLTHASLLVAKTDGDRISIRGNWLRHTFLCEHLDIPASVAEELGERLVGLTRTEIVRERNTDGACKGCHGLIDPVGIGFEFFDATGRYDDSVDIGEFGIDPALPTAPEPEFASIAELAEKLRSMPAVVECLSERVFLYTQGRDPTREDACTLADASSGFARASSDFRVLLENLVTSPAFRLRRAPAPTP